MTTMIDANLIENQAAGGTFEADGREFTIIGWFTATAFVHELYTFEAKPYGDEPFMWAQRWIETAPYRFELTDDSGWTVLDLVHRGWKDAPAHERPEDSR